MRAYTFVEDKWGNARHPYRLWYVWVQERSTSHDLSANTVVPVLQILGHVEERVK